MVGSCFVVGCVCSWELEMLRFNARIESRIGLAPSHEAGYERDHEYALSRAMHSTEICPVPPFGVSG